MDYLAICLDELSNAARKCHVVAGIKTGNLASKIQKRYVVSQLPRLAQSIPLYEGLYCVL